VSVFLGVFFECLRDGTYVAQSDRIARRLGESRVSHECDDREDSHDRDDDDEFDEGETTGIFCVHM